MCYLCSYAVRLCVFVCRLVVFSYVCDVFFCRMSVEFPPCALNIVVYIHVTCCVDMLRVFACRKHIYGLGSYASGLLCSHVGGCCFRI